MKIVVNDNLMSIFNFINTSPNKVDYKDLIDYVITENKYKEFYLNQNIINKLIDYHNESISKEQRNLFD